MNSTFHSTKTPGEVREEFRRRGEPLASWARRNGFHPKTVYALFYGTNKGCSGNAHRAAVLLGLKEGTIEERGAS